MRKSETQVLVVGAGPTGLMLALWLARLEVPVRIVDKAAEPGTTSRALVNHARTLEFYDQLGIADEALARGIKFNAARLWAHSHCAGRIEIGDLAKGLSPFPFMFILPQDVQEKFLGEKLAALGVEVERGTELTGLHDSGDVVTARLTRADGSEEECLCPYLAGCDGASSAVRHVLNLQFPGGTYEHMFYVADVQAEGPMINGELNLALDTADFLGVFPMPGSGNVRLIGTVKSGAGHLDKGTSGLTPNLTFADVSPAILEHLKVEVKRVNWFSTYHVHHRVASHFRVGRAFLLGDAAHIHSPVGGQGMNTGLGDAVNLGWKLAMALEGRGGARLLDSYAIERMAFARRLVATTDRAFTFVMNDGPVARMVRENVVPRVMPRLMGIDSVRRYFFRTVSQILIEYHASPLSSGRAGRVRGGDRLPWTGDNFAPLRSLRWQVHVYGTANEEVKRACDEGWVPLHVFPWNDAADQAGFQRDAAYLVRPDGYVGIAGAAAPSIRTFNTAGLRD
jgi:2-polyprenyl-6-methoxyphenol hydroxylase-like FAD-dependent oxidoreductase